MNRILTIAAVLLLAISAFATDRFNQNPQQLSVATTARIMKIDAKARTMKVRGAENSALKIAPEFRESLWQRIGVKMPSMKVPGVTIALPGKANRIPQIKSDVVANPNEYMILTTNDTAFQDGPDSLRFEDFKTGETISVHGELRGAILTATRIAKWD